MKKLKNILEHDVKKVVASETGTPERAISIREDGYKIVSLVTGRKIASYDPFKEVLAIL